MSEGAMVMSIFIGCPILTYIGFRMYDMTTREYVGWRPMFLKRSMCRNLLRKQLTEHVNRPRFGRSDQELAFVLKGMMRSLALMNIDWRIMCEDKVCQRMILTVKDLG